MASRKNTFLDDAIDMIVLGSHSIKEDDFNHCFQPVSSLTMQSSGILYIFSFISRYFILFPARVLLLLLGVAVFIVSFVLGATTNRSSICQASCFYMCKYLACIWSCHVKHIGIKHRESDRHLYVANHTSFLDFILLSSHKFCHACISEQHGGLFGFIFSSVLSKTGSISFRRSERHDRLSVVVKVREHVKRSEFPMLIFPEGTCVNNRAVLLFQKGAFDLDAKVFPVAVRFKKNIMDPYWNRRYQRFTSYLFYIMTRWRVDAEIHWLEPMSLAQNETPAEFAYRVQNAIASAAGIKSALWNGYLKSSPALAERDLLKASFKSFYKNLPETHPKKNSSGTENGQLGESSKLYFAHLSYTEFIHSWLTEYIKMKNNKNYLLEQSTNGLETIKKIMVVQEE
ncbi:glycerol-3-phosphate O-acyltransferase 3/4 [Enteropsectra breve]|nr:glycerol-3-phosphate O-acyltransferase 3/4 [Enteropsectra breve]